MITTTIVGHFTSSLWFTGTDWRNSTVQGAISTNRISEMGSVYGNGLVDTDVKKIVELMRGSETIEIDRNTIQSGIPNNQCFDCFFISDTKRRDPTSETIGASKTAVQPPLIPGSYASPIDANIRANSIPNGKQIYGDKNPIDVYTSDILLCFLTNKNPSSITIATITQYTVTSDGVMGLLSVYEAISRDSAFRDYRLFAYCGGSSPIKPVLAKDPVR